MPNDAQLAVVVEALNRVTVKVIQQVTLDAVANLTEPPPTGTPIDTGWARNNWVPSIGTPLESPVGSPDNPAAAAAARDAGIAEVLTRYTLSDGVIFISNNVPYIGRLNDGSSTQSPAGFIQAAILRAVSGLQGFNLTVT